VIQATRQSRSGCICPGSTSVCSVVAAAAAATPTNQLFERCAGDFGSDGRHQNLRRAALWRRHLYSRSGRHSSAVEQLFRKQQVLGSNPSVGSISCLLTLIRDRMGEDRWSGPTRQTTRFTGSAGNSSSTSPTEKTRPSGTHTGCSVGTYPTPQPGRGMDTDLVIRAQGGDQEAFAARRLRRSSAKARSWSCELVSMPMTPGGRNRYPLHSRSSWDENGRISEDPPLRRRRPPGG
jgi:hypothetical protein